MLTEVDGTIRRAVFNAMDFCGPPITAAKVAVEDEGYHWSESLESKVLDYIELWLMSGNSRNSRNSRNS